MYNLEQNLIFNENIEIEKIKLSVRLYNCLKKANINTLNELMILEDEDLIRIRNLGRKTLEELSDLRQNIINGVIPLVEFSVDDNISNQCDIHLVEFIDEIKKPIRSILFYNSYGGYSEDLLIKDLNLSVRSYNALINNGFRYVSEVLDITFGEFNSIKNLGQKSRDEILELIKKTSYIIYDEEREINLSFMNLEEHIELIVEEFRCSKIKVDIKELKSNLLISLSNIGNMSILESKMIQDFLSEENLYIIYEKKFFSILFKNEIIRYINELNNYPSIEDIIGIFPRHIRKTKLVINLLNIMIEENIIEKFEGRYRIHYPELNEVINNISDERDRLIIVNRLFGKTLEEVGATFGITRERVRQKESKIIGKLPRVREDDFKYTFQKYNWNKDTFVYAFNVDVNIYNYLDYKYKKDIVDLIKSLEDDTLPVKVRQKVESYIYRDYLLIGNTRIKKDKQHILDYVLKSFCKEEISVEDLSDIYTMFLEDLNLDNETFKYPVRYFESTLANSNKVLWKFKKKLRYFDFGEFDAEKIISTLRLDIYKDVELSTLKIFNNYNEVMKEWGIYDEYELHNLMKKVIGDKNNVGIKFLRMPNVEFGNADREMQVLELLVQSAPIQNYELAKLYEVEYGVKAETALANCFKAIEDYYHDSMYCIDYKCLNTDELEKMKNILGDDIYLLSEVKRLYKENFPLGDITTINPYSLRCLGFKITSLFIYSDKFNSIEEYVKFKVMNNEILDATDLLQRFGNYPYFYNSLQDKKNKYEIIEFEPNIFINITRLNRIGITKNDLIDFVKSVDEFINEEIFTIKSLRKKGFGHYLDDLGFDDWFYSSILKCNEMYKSRRVDGNVILKKTNGVITLNDLVEHVVTKFRKIDIYDLIEYVYDEYGVKINRGKIPHIASEKELYYDAVMEKVYIDYDEYFEEV